MKHEEFSARLLTAVFAATILALIGFNTAVADPNETTGESTVDTAVAEAGEEAVETVDASAETAEDEAVSPGLQVPMDGSSVEAFEASLEEVQPQMTEAEFITLNNALDYLLVYDLSARRDRAKLYANLDGLTGEQIIERVAWRKPPRQKR